MNGYLASALKLELEPEELVENLYFRTVCRPPTAEELSHWSAELKQATSLREAAEDLFWALLELAGICLQPLIECIGGARLHACRSEPVQTLERGSTDVMSTEPAAVSRPEPPRGPSDRFAGFPGAGAGRMVPAPRHGRR